MRNGLYWLAGTLWMALLLTLSLEARAQDFELDLGQAREIIAGKEVARTAIPDGAKELTVYPLAVERPRDLLSELPGQPMRQVTPMPLARAWWKYPFYATLGLPRDLLDGLMGCLNYVPFLSIPVVMGAYELVPTQLFVRDPRDWHRWPGLGMNALRHGPIDGGSWGWMPSLHCWHFTYPSQNLARKNEIFNQKLKAQLDDENRKIEASNTALDNRLRDTRNRTLAALTVDNGREAAFRMISYRHTYPLDEGGFALFATAMALYITDGPDWVAPVLWSELEYAQPRLLIEAEKLLAATERQHPERTALSEALIYTRLILGRNQGAIDAAQALLKEKPADPYRLRLVFEAAMGARESKLARQTRAAMSPNSYDEPTRQLMDIRLKLLSGDAASVIDQLTQMQAQHPEDAYLAYYLACAQLMLAQKLDNPAEAYKKASVLMAAARDRAPGPALRIRADREVNWVKSILSGISGQPALFTDQIAPPAVK